MNKSKSNLEKQRLQREMKYLKTVTNTIRKMMNPRQTGWKWKEKNKEFLEAEYIYRSPKINLNIADPPIFDKGAKTSQ